jgi:hypothetical protein
MVAFASNRGRGEIWPFGKRKQAESAGSCILPGIIGWKPARREPDLRSADSLWAKFAHMIPEIREHTLSVCRPDESNRLETFLYEVFASAFEVYCRLADCGLSDLAYPKPLCLAALVWLGHSESKDGR